MIDLLVSVDPLDLNRPYLSPASRANNLFFGFVTLGLAPQALCCRLLRRLDSRRQKWPNPRSGGQRKAWGEAKRNPRNTSNRNDHSPRSGRQTHSDKPFIVFNPI